MRMIFDIGLSFRPSRFDLDALDYRRIPGISIDLFQGVTGFGKEVRLFLHLYRSRTIDRDT